jgi:hypothetical protein
MFAGTHTPQEKQSIEVIEMVTLFVLIGFVLGTLFGWKVYEICIALGLQSLINNGDGVYIDEVRGQLIFDISTLQKLGYYDVLKDEEDD